MRRPRNPTFVDLCSGAGGFSRGFQRAGWTALLGVDSCEKSLKTYSRNICENTLCTDLLEVGAFARILENLNGASPTAVIAGPPCQGFSMAGRRDPRDPRNKVFVECARIAVKLKPRVIIFENVPSLAKEPFRPFFDKAARIMHRNGYSTREFQVQAGNFGVPQRRWRLFLIAFRKAQASEIDTIVADLAKQEHRQLNVRDAWVDLPFEDSPKIPNHVSMRHSAKVKAKIAKIDLGKGPLSYRKLDPDKPALTLISGHSAMPCHYIANRTITVREAARIQSFDDAFVFEGGIRSQMNQVANAVPPRVAEIVGKALHALLKAA